MTCCINVACCLQILAETLDNLHKAGLDDPFYQPVHTFILNPKSITMEELYGGIDKLTMEWHDGLMGITVRNAVQVCGVFSIVLQVHDLCCLHFPLAVYVFSHLLNPLVDCNKDTNCCACLFSPTEPSC